MTTPRGRWGPRSLTLTTNALCLLPLKLQSCSGAKHRTEVPGSSWPQGTSQQHGGDPDVPKQATLWKCREDKGKEFQGPEHCHLPALYSVLEEKTEGRSTGHGCRARR